MKLYGKTKDTNGTMRFVISLAGQTMLDGIVQTTDSSLEDFLGDNIGSVVVAFDFPTSLVGSLPFSLRVEGGTFRWTISETNYHGNMIKDLTVNIANGVWPKGAPASEEEFIVDACSLTMSDLVNKYGESLGDNITYQGVTSRENWQDVNGENSFISDGRENVMIDGVSWNLDSAARAALTQIGDVHYSIQDGQTFTCNMVIAPAGDV
jgi:hypothetical protein